MYGSPFSYFDSNLTWPGTDYIIPSILTMVILNSLNMLYQIDYASICVVYIKAWTLSVDFFLSFLNSRLNTVVAWCREYFKDWYAVQKREWNVPDVHCNTFLEICVENYNSLCIIFLVAIGQRHIIVHYENIIIYGSYSISLFWPFNDLSKYQWQKFASSLKTSRCCHKEIGNTFSVWYYI